MKSRKYIFLASILIFSAITASYTYASDAGNSAVNAVSQETAAQDEEAILKELESLLSENYCPDYDVKKWNFFDPAPACLQEQAKKVAVLVYGPSEFSDEEEQRLRELAASRMKVQAKLKEFGCKPGQFKNYDGPPPECMRRSAEIMKEQARKDNIEGGGLSIIQNHVLETKLRHLADMDRSHLLLAQMLSLYTCHPDKNTVEECVLSFYNDLKRKW